MEDFEGRVAVVTGTANPRRIGFATCRRLAGLGSRLVLADIDAGGTAARATELCEGGAEPIAVGADMADRGAVEGIADATYGRLATTSGAGASGTMYGNGTYTVTKAAVTSLMECLHGQLRDAGADIVTTLV
jgi:NAD(P)-dependent dehydrogenase (short-subunit alcohol dehydrogenase family)